MTHILQAPPWLIWAVVIALWLVFCAVTVKVLRAVLGGARVPSFTPRREIVSYYEHEHIYGRRREDIRPPKLKERK